MSRPRPLAVAAALVLAAACGPRPADVAGAWEGTWAGADGMSAGRFRVEITQRGRVIRGPITLSLDWLPEARIEGVVEARTVRWGVLRGGVPLLSFDGTVTGDAAEGRYTIAGGGEGTWSARRVGR